MTKLYLIRHAKTTHVDEKKYCGFTDPPLNDEGIKQAVALSDCLRNTKIDKIYSSDLKRSIQTAELVFSGRDIEKYAEFREMNFGAFEDMTCEEITKKFGELYDNWIDNMETAKVPEGESMQDLQKRANEKLTEIIKENKDKTIALVSHGGPIRAILCDVLGYGLNKFWKINQKHL